MRLSLSKVRDRFPQQLWVERLDATGQPEASYCLWESVEGDDRDPSPPSPPVQDLSVESRPGGHVALGVGMAGQSLWSISVEAFADQGCLRFDIACNHRGRPTRPVSTYRLLDAAGWKPGSHSTEHSEVMVQWQPVVLDQMPTTVHWDPVSGLEFQGQEQSSRDTYRWGYEVRLQRT